MGDDVVSPEPGCYWGDIAALVTPASTTARMVRPGCPCHVSFAQYSLDVSSGNCVVDYFKGFPVKLIMVVNLTVKIQLNNKLL